MNLGNPYQCFSRSGNTSFILRPHSFFAIYDSCEKDVSIKRSNMVKQTNKMMVLLSLIKIFSKSFVGRKTSLQMNHGYIS